MSDVGQHLLSGIAQTIRGEESLIITFFSPGAMSGLASSLLLQPCTSSASCIPLRPSPFALVDLIKTRVQQGDAPLAQRSALPLPRMTEPAIYVCPGKLVPRPFAPPRDRSFLPPGYSVSGAARPQH